MIGFDFEGKRISVWARCERVEVYEEGHGRIMAGSRDDEGKITPDDDMWINGLLVEAVEKALVEVELEG